MPRNGPSPTPNVSPDAREIWFDGSLPWPFLVARDRYNGCYSGGSWFALTDYEIPEGAVADDVTTCEFWGEVQENQGVLVDADGNAVAYGVGATAIEAMNVCLSAAKGHNSRVRRDRSEASDV